MEIDPQRTEDTAFDLCHLVKGKLVVDHHLHMRHLLDDRVHVLHTGGDTTQILGHAVAHHHPLELQVLLRELQLLVFDDAIRVVRTQ